jgi:hypothetical protein
VAIENLDKKVTSLQVEVAGINNRLTVVETKVDILKETIDRRFDKLENFLLVMIETNRRVYSQLPGPRFNQD